MGTICGVENPWKSGIFIGKYPGKILENDLGPGKSWNLLGNDAEGSFWLQIDMFLQTKIAIIVATRYVFWAASMPKTLSQPGLHPRPRWWSLKTSKLLSVAIFIHRWLTMECFVTNRVGTLGKGMLATAYKSAVQKVSAQLISTCRDSTKVNFEIKIKR